VYAIVYTQGFQEIFLKAFLSASYRFWGICGQVKNVKNKAVKIGKKYRNPRRKQPQVLKIEAPKILET
jgi:hypothetical protein